MRFRVLGVHGAPFKRLTGVLQGYIGVHRIDISFRASKISHHPLWVVPTARFTHLGMLVGGTSRAFWGRVEVFIVQGFLG